MKRALLLLGAFCVTPGAFAAETDTDRNVSVFDANPRCMERTVDSNSRECILRSEGAPRQFYPVEVTPVLPEPPIMPPNPPANAQVPREAPRTGQGG